MMSDKRSVLWSALIVLGCILALTFVSPDVAYAHDCMRDPLNAADCMRSGGFRETIAIVVSLGGALATILVNILSGVPITPPAASPPPATPPAASPPREMTLTDAAGREHQYEWSDKHQGYVNILTGGLLDPTLWTEYNRNLQENIRFTEEQRQKMESRQTDFDRQMDRMVENQRQEMERLRQEQYRQQLERRRAEIEARMRNALGDAKKYTSFAEGYDKVLTTLEWVKWGADTAIDVGAQLSPGTGKLIKSAYTFASNVGEGIGEGMADPKKFASHVIKGAVKDGIDIGKDFVKDYLSSKALKNVPEKWLQRLPPDWKKNPLVSGWEIPKDYGELPSVAGIDATKAIVNVIYDKMKDSVNPVEWGAGRLKKLIGT